jgi:ketosteroid isomerase-like protein
MAVDTRVEQQVNQVFDQLLKAYESGNTDEAMRYMSKDEDVTLIEPGADSISTGQQDVRKSIQADWDATEGDNPVKITRRWVSSDGNVAWLSGEHEISVNYQGKPLTMTGRFTAIAKQQDGGWKFHTLHFATPFPGRKPGEAWPSEVMGSHVRQG